MDRLVRALAAPDTRRDAADALAGLGAAAVPPVLRELTDEDSPVEWSTSAMLLRRLGAAAFDAVVRCLAVAGAPEVRRRLAWTLAGYGTALLDRYVAALSHPAAIVREKAAIGVQYCGADGFPAVPALLSLLDDEDADVASRAGFVLAQFGPRVIPVMRRIRAEGPGRQRAGALAVLASVGGEAALSERDRAAVERLIRVKLTGDRPRAPETCWLHWIAVPTGDQAGVMAELGLSRPRRVTFALGNDVVDADSHERDLRRVFVTPELDGWTFVIGSWCDPADDERRADVARLCVALSERYGRAQAYSFSEQDDASGWLVAEGGTVLRHWWTADGEDVPDEDADRARGVIGDPLPCEVARRAAIEAENAGEPEDIEGEWSWALREMAPEVAAAMGLSPLDITEDTPVRGTGVVALTPRGGGGEAFLGAYRI
ncbi:HEAT repeat domain-containing protein [Streptomyces sp. NPDC049879]|uniref:HEAT repeat domain-containing protein n=1 Tax=Streptomyces sp. NPDC049879 TaxID=3365598 RepID=UPI0037A5D493